MGELNFDLPGDQDIHHCTSYREGDWITWRCPHCADYERRMNWRTGEMRIKRAANGALHSGSSTRDQNMEALARYNFNN